MTLTSSRELPGHTLRRLVLLAVRNLKARPAVEVGAGLVLGLAVSLQAEPSVSAVWLVVAFVAMWATKLIPRLIVGLMLFAGFAAGTALGIPQSILSRNQIAYAKPGSGEIVGVITAEPSVYAHSIQFTVAVTDPKGELPAGMRLRVTSYHRAQQLYPGQVVRCRLVWHRASKNGYDRWLWLRGIYLKADLETSEINFVSDNPFRKYLSGIRRRCLGGLDYLLSRSHRGLVKGIALGDTSDLSSAEKRTLADTGVIHILSPSGLHVSIVFGFMWIALGLLSRNRAVRIVFSILAVWLYALVCGAEAPAVRSAIMCSIAGIAQWSHRDRDALSACALAAILILAIQPISLLDPSFQMSFVMVSFVLVISSAMAHHRYIPELWPRLKRKLLDLFVAGSLCALAAAPLSAFYFQRISIISPVTNILVAPPVAVITCVAPVAGWMSSVVDNGIVAAVSGGILTFCASWIDGAVGFCHRLPMNSLRMQAPSATMLIVYYICYLLLLVFMKSRRNKVNVVAA